MPLAGGTATELASIPTIGAPAFDATDLFWVTNPTPQHYATYTIVRASKDAQNQTQLGTVFGALENLATDGTSLYMTTNDGLYPLSYAITKTNLDGANPTSLDQDVGAPWFPNTFAFDDGYVYTAAARVPKGGGPAQPLFAASLPYDIVAGVALSNGSVFTMRMHPSGSSFGGPSDPPANASIVRMPTAGGKESTVVSGFLVAGTGGIVAADGNAAYYPTTSGLTRTAQDGSESTVLGPADIVAGIAFDATNVYWISWNTSGAATLYATCK